MAMVLIRIAFLFFLLGASAVQAQPAFRAAGTIGVPTSAVTPTAAAPAAAGVAAVASPASPAWPAHNKGDIGLLACESAGGQAPTLTVPATFADLTPGSASPQSSNVGTNGTRLTVWWARATSSAMTAPTVTLVGDHLYCVIVAYRNVVTAGNPWDVQSGGTQQMSVLNVAGITTTAANSMVVQAVARENDAAGVALASTPTNAGLGPINTRFDDGTTAGNGGGFFVWDGVRAAAGATGITSASLATPSIMAASFSLALTPAVVGVPPTFFGRTNPTVAGWTAGAVAIPWPAGHLLNDIGLLFCESADQAVTLSVPNGFSAAISNSPWAGQTRMTVFWARATGAAMAAPVVNDSGDHTYCTMLVYRGVIAAGLPYNVFGVAIPTRTATITGVTTTVANTRVVQIVARDSDIAGARFSGQTNAGLGAITEQFDSGIVTGNGGGISFWSGTRAAPGATGSTTVAVAGAEVAFITLALRPGIGLGVPATTALGDLMVASLSVAPQTVAFTTPAGWTAQAARVGTTTRQQVFFRFADAADAAGGVSYRWPVSGTTTGSAGAIASYSGVNATTPFDVISSNATPVNVPPLDPNTRVRATGTTTTVANTMVISTHSLASSVNYTAAPAGMAQRTMVFSANAAGAAGVNLQLNDVTQALPAATGDKFADVGSNGDAGTAYIFALRPIAPPVDHYAISYPGGATAVTCDPHQVTITAHNAAHGAVAPAGGTTLSFTTSSATGVWTTLVAGSGIWTPSGLNNGVATYTWPGGESSVTVRLRHNNPVTFGINLLDSNARTEGVGAEDPNITFADAVFRVTDAAGAAVATFGTHLAGKNSDTGFGAQTRFLQAIRTDTNTGSCVGLIQNQTVMVEMAGARINPTGGASQVSIRDSTSTMVPVATSAGGPPGSFTGVSLAFDAQSKAPLVFNYPDAGSLSLHARFALPAPPAASFVSGSSNTFVVRPFGLRISGVTTSGAPAPGDPFFAVAGQNFNTTVTAVAWKTGDDADNNGVPDSDAQIAGNAATPNFGQETVPATADLTHTLNAPGGGNAGTLGGATNFTGFVAGARTQAVNWSEVGFINLFAASANYLGSGQNLTNSAAGLTGVGRFRPAHFFVSGGTLTHRPAAACAPASVFSYMNEGIALGFTLNARNSAGVVTQNYTGSYATLVLTTFANWSLGARSGTTDLTARLDPGVAPIGSWLNGAASNVVLTTAVFRATPDAPDGPYTATAFGIAPVSDGVAMDTLDLDVDNNAVMDRKNLGVSGEFRFGRLRVLNAAGSLNTVLPVPFRTEYWNGTLFALNTQDSCTTVARNTVAMSFTPPSTLAACETAFTAASVTMASGAATLYLAAPGAGNTGSVLLTPQLYSPAAGTFCASVGGGTAATTTANQGYLTGRWNDAANPDANANTSHDDNPSGRASFGVFGGQPNNYIYFRENY